MKTFRNAVSTKGVLMGLLCSGLILSCGKKKSDDSSSGTSPEDVTNANPLAGAYPSSLAITVFPTASTTSLTETYLAEATTAAKSEDAAKILKGEVENCLPAALKSDPVQGEDETCYEFDQDMIYGSQNGTKGTKTGKNSKGEACLPAFARTKTKRVIDSVDRALGTIQMGMCLGKKKGVAKELSAVGDSVDLAESFGSNEGKVTVSKAKITREADANGFQNFKIELSVTRKDGIPMDITLYHTKKDDKNTLFSGVLQHKEKLSDTEKKGEGVSLLAGDRYRLMSIQYSRGTNATTGKPEIRYELRNGIFDSSLVAKAFENNNSNTLNQLDLNVGADFTATEGSQDYGKYTGFTANNNAVMGITYIAFGGNPETNEGTFTYAQNPGSNFDENARGMTATLELKDGVLKGCAYSGANGYSVASGYSIRGAIKSQKKIDADVVVFNPRGFYHPFFSGGTGPTTDADGKYYTKTQGPSTAKWYQVEAFTATTELPAIFVTEQMSNIITKQCYKQDATSQMYLIDETTSAKGYDLKEVEKGKTAIAPPPPPKKPDQQAT